MDQSHKTTRSEWKDLQWKTDVSFTPPRVIGSKAFTCSRMHCHDWYDVDNADGAADDDDHHHHAADHHHHHAAADDHHHSQASPEPTPSRCQGWPSHWWAEQTAAIGSRTPLRRYIAWVLVLNTLMVSVKGLPLPCQPQQHRWSLSLEIVPRGGSGYTPSHHNQQSASLSPSSAHHIFQYTRVGEELW